MNELLTYANEHNMGLKDVLSAALGVPEAGSEEAEAAAKAEEDRFAL